MECKKLHGFAEHKMSSSSSSLFPSEMTQDFLPTAKNPVDYSQCSIIWRSINVVMATFLVLAAFVQINDPDPYIWIPVYLFPAVLSLTVAIKPSAPADSFIWRSSCLVLIVLCLIGAIYLLSVVFDLLSKGSANILVYEEVREFFGLVIVIIWLAICRFSSFSSSPCDQSTRGWPSALLAVTCIIGTMPLIFWSMCFINPLYDRLDHCQEMMHSAHHYL